MRKINAKPVGSYPENRFGLYDMCGNVSEWVDAIHGPYPGRPGAVCRGGGWETSIAVFIRSGCCSGRLPHYSTWDIGFRCVRAVELIKH